MSNQSVQLLRLHEVDNVLTLIVSIEANEVLHIEGEAVTVPARLPIGHKVAARPIAAGEKIFKYGVPIGSAVADIALGAHVHTHNIKSDYLPTFVRETQGRYFSEQK